MNRVQERILVMIVNAATAFAFIQTTVESNAAPAAGAWKILKPSTVPAVFAPAVVGPDNRIYVIGGSAAYDSTNSLAVTRVYDLRTDMWTEGAPMPTPRNCPGAALGPDGKIYVIGGQVMRHALDTVEAYEIKSDTWTRCRPMPTARTDPSIVPAKGADGLIHLFAIGGRDFRAPGNGLPTVEAYDPTTDTWTMMAPMPTHRHAQTEALGPDGLIYIIGGANHDHANFLDSVEVYDPIKNVWSASEPLPYQVECAMATSTTCPGGEVLVFGGWRTPDKIESHTACAFSPRTKTWRPLRDIPTARAAGAAVSISTPDGSIHVCLIGGKDSECSAEEYTFHLGESPK
jgi:N-acetylneuraminic acid mutarotase